MVYFKTINSSVYSEIKQALQLAAEDKWEQAHEIAQSNEGHAAYDRVHALLHRMEGDKFNASYWYSRIGVQLPTISFAEEIQVLLSELDKAKKKLK